MRHAIASSLLAALLPGLVLLIPGLAVGGEPPVIEITSPFSSGPGSIREAIERANAAGTPVRIVSRLAKGSEVLVFRALPALAGFGIELDGAGMTLKGGDCVRPDGRDGCDGLVVAGPNITVRRLKSTEFTFDGIAVRGRAAKNVHIVDCECTRNSDDGVGISGGATEVTVEGCVLLRNGFRTKGKGILVFDYSKATLRNNVVRFNRDGITISKRSRAELYGNTISDNFDKGLGAAGADINGRHNTISRNGAGGGPDDPAPNGDGLRATIDSTVILEDIDVTDNGDTGVVAIGVSTVSLVRGRVTGNRGPGVHATDKAVIELRDIELTGNGKGDEVVEGEAKVVRDYTPGVETPGHGRGDEATTTVKPGASR